MEGEAMTAMRHPRRQRHGDRLVSPDASAASIRCDHAIAPFDRVAREMENTWGVDRLVSLVSPETAQKYGSALAKLNAAIAEEKPEDCAARAAVCIRGMKVMDEEARAAGHKPLTPTYWQVRHGDRTFVLARDVNEWPLIRDELPGVPIYSIHEVAVALAKQAHVVEVAAADHPPAEVVRISPRNDSLDDPIPF